MHIIAIAIKPAKRAPMTLAGNATITKELGIQGDCRGGGGLLRRRQITLLSWDQWKEACQEHGKEIPWQQRRANLLIGDVRFGPELVGKQVHIAHEVILEITGETEPCKRMDAVSEGLQEALKKDWRGGVTCRVLAGGSISRGWYVEVK